MSETKYFTVPIPMLQGLLAGQKTIKNVMVNVMDYSIYYHAKHSVYGENGEMGGYNSMETQLKAASDFLNIQTYLQRTLSNGKELYEGLQNKPYCSIAAQIMWDYYNNPKTDYQLALLCAFCAVRSIIGKAEYRKTNKGLIIARMFGYNDAAAFKSSLPEKFSKYRGRVMFEHYTKEVEAREKYAKRYHMDKLLTDLELSWGLKRYSDHVRGMFISFSLDYKTLAVVNENSKKKHKLNDLKEVKKQAMHAAKKSAIPLGRLQRI